MPVPLQITFKDMDPSPAIEARIREKAAHLEQFGRDLLRCHATVAALRGRGQQGKRWRVRVELFMPRGEVVVAREGPKDGAHEDVYVAMRDAFDAAVRQLEDRVRVLRGQTKHHEAPEEGRIVRLFPEQGYGFIETSDGQEVYFHRNSVIERGFDRLAVGDAVRVVVDEEESAQGPQASTVHPKGRSHAVG
jgi:cold shock CspA family protein